MRPELERALADLRVHLEQSRRRGLTRVHVDEARRAVRREEWEARYREVFADLGAPGSPPETDAEAGKLDPGAKQETVLASAGAAASGTEASNTSVAGPAPDPAALLAELDRTSVRGCTRCKLHGGRTNTVFGVGNPHATLVLVGEAPGRDEDRQGEPFVGAAGQLLNKILAAIGFTREDVYICNVLKCRPPGNRDPEPDEVAACEPNLLGQLDIIRPKIICALGRIAAQTLLRTNAPLGRLRRSVHDYHGVPMMVTYHPAALLRNQKWKRPTWEDVQKLRELHDELVQQDA